MVNASDQTDLQTDAYPLAQTTGSEKRDSLNKKKILAISAAAMLLGGGAYTVAHQIQKRTGEPGIDIEEPSAVNEPTLDLPVEIDVAGKVSDTQSFDQAFTTAREEVGMGGVFNWQGRWFNTFEKEEWGSLSLEQRQEFTEMVVGEKLPVRSYTPATSQTTETQPVPAEVQPTVIEGSLNGQPVMGLDFDLDGIIDTIVLDGGNGNIYRVVDATGDAGLDTVYQYNSLDGEVIGMVRLEQPFILSNDDFSDSLENAMAQEVVNSILELEETITEPAPDLQNEFDGADGDETTYLANSLEEEDTYVNNGDVRDMDQ
ncbi:hypothetical protein ACFQ4C_30245 [Larkinella insperata]|uniref:Uncharacterized protein n=1 Tax=Larkinella insperata TaxID=332158 RepID=A0ABW3QL25_9BACT